MSIEARAYDDAIAFRYVVPKQNPLDDFRLTKESTEFRMHQDSRSTVCPACVRLNPTSLFPHPKDLTRFEHSKVASQKA